MNEVTRFRAVAAMAACLLSVSTSGRALAEDAPPPGPSNPPVLGGSAGYFGEHGEIAISGDMKFSVLHQSQTGNSYTSYELQPAIDYFVSTNVSVGGLLGISRDPLGGNDSRTTVVVGGRVGYNVFLSNVVSLWIRGGLNYGHFTDHVARMPDSTGSYVSLSVYAPLLWHPVPHFFLGAGPFLEQDLHEGNGGAKATDIGISSTIGGYFGGL